MRLIKYVFLNESVLINLSLQYGRHKFFRDFHFTNSTSQSHSKI